MPRDRIPMGGGRKHEEKSLRCAGLSFFSLLARAVRHPWHKKFDETSPESTWTRGLLKGLERQRAIHTSSPLSNRQWVFFAPISPKLLRGPQYCKIRPVEVLQSSSFPCSPRLCRGPRTELSSGPSGAGLAFVHPLQLSSHDDYPLEERKDK